MGEDIVGQLYEGRRGLLLRKQWFGRIIDTSNGENLLRTSEGYNNKAACRHALEKGSPGIRIED